MHAAAIRFEDGAVTFAARGSGRHVIGGFGHHRMGIVAVGADGRDRIALSEQGGVYAAPVVLELVGVTGAADLLHRERILTDAGDLFLDRRMVLERGVGMADGAPEQVMSRFRKRPSVHVQGERFSVRQFLLEPLDGMAIETLLGRFGDSAVGGTGGQARNSEHYHHHHQCQPGSNDQVRVELRSGHFEFAPGDRHFRPYRMSNAHQRTPRALSEKLTGIKKHCFTDRKWGSLIESLVSRNAPHLSIKMSQEPDLLSASGITWPSSTNQFFSFCHHRNYFCRGK